MTDAMKAGLYADLLDRSEVFGRWIQQREDPDVRDYPLLDELARSLAAFLLEFPAEKWRKRHKKLVGVFSSFDSEHRALLSSVDFDAMMQILDITTADVSVRFYLLGRVRRFERADSITAGIRFLVDDPNPAVRAEALMMLAAYRWEGTEQAALELWESDCGADKMSALEALMKVSSPRFPALLEAAKNSDDKGLQLTAKALAVLNEYQQSDSSKRKDSGK